VKREKIGKLLGTSVILSPSCQAFLLPYPQGKSVF